MPAPKWRRLRDKWRREVFLRGSPSYRWGVWTAGLAGGLFWIWMVEKDMPVEERRIFLPFKRQIPMREDEILRWNAKLSGKNPQDLLAVSTKVQHLCNVEAEEVQGRPGNGGYSAAEFRKRSEHLQEGSAGREEFSCGLTVDQLREKVKQQIAHEDMKREGVPTKKKESLFGGLKMWAPSDR